MYEKNVTTGVTTTYYYAAATRVAMRQGGVLYYLHGDHLGSTSLVTNITGTVVARQLYGPYGAPRWSSGTLPTDYRYTGQRAETGLGSLYDYGARFYSVSLGRFLSADSIVPSPGNPQDLNRYSYAYNNPLRYNDPSGHCPMCVTAAIGALGGAIVGAAMAAGPQIIQNLQTGQPLTANIDPSAVAKAAAVGAVTGLVAGATMGIGTAVLGSGLGATMAAGAVGGALAGQAGRATDNALSGRDVTTGLGNPADLATDALAGAAGAAVGYGAGKLVGRLAGAVDCSFSADTLVATQDSQQAIGTLGVGAVVLAYNETLGITDYYTVTAVWVHDDPVIVYLRIDDEQVETTLEHPFFTAEWGWLPAGELWPDMHVRNANGEYGTVQAIEVVQQLQPMYNLTVAQAHTFFVGQQQWLVHNACPPIKPYEVGLADDLRARSIKGDGLDIHHAPQAHPASQVIPGYNPNNGPAIALPHGEHVQLNASNLSGAYGGTARSLMARDIWRLRNSTNAPNSALRGLLDLARKTYPGVLE